jgi:small subunit ribosomal protein S19e
LRSHFGKKKRRGVQPPKHMKASGKILREVVTQLKKNGYVENYANESGNTFGLVLTRQGRAELDKIATKLVKDKQPKA